MSLPSSDLITKLNWRCHQKMDPARRCLNKLARILEKHPAASSTVCSPIVLVVTNQAQVHRSNRTPGIRGQVTDCSTCWCSRLGTYTTERISTMFDRVNDERGLQTKAGGVPPAVA
jgi:hypothetical protein